MTSLAEILNGRNQAEDRPPLGEVLLEIPQDPPEIVAGTSGSAPVIAPPPVIKSAQDAAEAARLAIEEALASGVSHEDLTAMVAIAKPLLNEKDQFVMPGLEADTPPVYEQLRPGMIDLPSAASKYGIKVRTLRTWINRGHVEPIGRLKARAPGGGYWVVWEQDLIDHMNAPPNKGGRPRSRKT